MEPHQICSLIKAARVGAPSPLPHLVQSSHVFHSRPGRTATVRAPGSQPMGHLALPRLLFPSLRVTDPPWGLPMTPPLGWAAAAKGGGGEVGRQDAVLERQNCRLHWLLSAGSTKSWNVCFSDGSLHNKLPPNVMAEKTHRSPLFCGPHGRLLLRSAGAARAFATTWNTHTSAVLVLGVG